VGRYPGDRSIRDKGTCSCLLSRQTRFGLTGPNIGSDWQRDKLRRWCRKAPGRWRVGTLRAPRSQPYRGGRRDAMQPVMRPQEREERGPHQYTKGIRTLSAVHPIKPRGVTGARIPAYTPKPTPAPRAARIKGADKRNASEVEVSSHHAPSSGNKRIIATATHPNRRQLIRAFIGHPANKLPKNLICSAKLSGNNRIALDCDVLKPPLQLINPGDELTQRSQIYRVHEGPLLCFRRFNREYW
jgi:hypothetical protein